MFKKLLIFLLLQNILISFKSKNKGKILQTKGLLCKWCEKFQNELISLYFKNAEKTMKSLEVICKIKGSDPLCKYYVNRDTKTLFENKVKFLKETNYLCSNKLKLCDLVYEEYDFKEFRKNLYIKYPKINYKKIFNKNNRLKNKNFVKIFSVLKNKNSFLKKNQFSKLSTNKIPKTKKFSALVLNDVHIDKYYKYKSKVDCGLPAGGCCTGRGGEPKDKSDEAGYWGSHLKEKIGSCDIPFHFWTSTLEYIKKNIDNFDFVFLLGDNFSHSYYIEPVEEIKEINEYFFATIKKYFGDKIVIPVLGNHECDPIDNFDFNEKQNFVHENIFPLYKDFISEQKIEDLKNNGFYEIEYSEYNIKVISINSQMGDIFNMPLLKNSTDPLNFFSNFAETLYNSEKKGQKVIILTHIPIADLYSLNGFTLNFKSILERFKNTVMGSFSGHTHNDHIRFVKDYKNENIHINYISPSLTTFDNYNPSFRIYHFRDNSLFDFDQYRFDLESHNKKAEKNNFEFKFHIAYSFKKEYNIQKIRGKNFFDTLEKKISFDRVYLKKYCLNFLSREEDENWDSRAKEFICELNDNDRDKNECYRKSKIPSIVKYVNLYKSIFQQPWLLKINVN